MIASRPSAWAADRGPDHAPAGRFPRQARGGPCRCGCGRTVPESSRYSSFATEGCARRVERERRGECLPRNCGCRRMGRHRAYCPLTKARRTSS